MQNKFQQKLNQLTTTKQSFLLFRKPETSIVELWSDEGKGENEFIFNRFDNSETIIFKTDEVLELDINQFTQNIGIELEDSNINEAISYDDYIRLINKTVSELNSTETNKIVISRIKEIVNNDFNLIETFKNLHQAYPKAFLYVWYTPTNGLWIGASPELLLKESNFKIETVSLAGTLPKDEDWTAKEIHEQQVVTDYILNQLSVATNVVSDGPHTIDAGFFNHLKTYISANVETYQEVESILKALHPTPAVCGMPKDKAKDYIIRNEGYDRKYYAGFFGFKKPAESLYFVNLRCAQIFSNVVKLYVGGGIMPDSIAEKEWHETEMKSKTIGNLLSFRK